MKKLLTVALTALAMVLCGFQNAQSAIITAGELIVDVRNQDLDGSTNVWINQATSTNSVGDFMQLDSGPLNVALAFGDGTNYANAIRVDGVAANAVNSASQTPSSVESNETCSVEAWVYAESITEAQTVVSWGDTTAHGALRQFRYGRLFGAWYIDANDWGTTLPVGQWTHVAWVFDPPYVYGYINGVNTIIADLSTDTDYPLITAHTVLSLGAARPGGTADAFDGYIADVRVHTGVLDAFQVENNYNEGMTAPADLSPTVTGLENKSAFVGQNVSLEPIFTGGLPLLYQWSSNSIPIVGATNAMLTLTNVQLAANGSVYEVAVSNAWGSASDSMTLTVETVPDIGPRTINVNIVRNNADVYTGKAIAPGAGTSWNLFNTTGTTSPHTVSGIVDSQGNLLEPVTISIASAQNLMNTYTDTSAGSPNPELLMKDYMYKGLLTVSVSGLPDGEYDLYVYAHGNNSGQASTITVAATNGGAVAFTTDLDEFRNIYQTNALNNSYAAVTGTVSALPVFTFTTDYLNGFQIQNALPVIEGLVDQTVTAGTNLVIDAGVAGRAPISYQWSKSGIEMPGEIYPTLTLNDVQSGDAGEYTLVVGNSLGSDTNSMILTVGGGGPITIDSINVAGGTASLSWTADAGAGYSIQSAPDLAADSWTEVTNVSSVGTQTTDVPLSGASQEFYRIEK